MSLNTPIDLEQPVLLVEDEAFVASDIEQQLRDMSFEAITVCMTYSDARMQLAEGDFGLAIFDINVGGKMSFALMAEAVEQELAVIAISGYLPGPHAMEGCVFLKKPIEREALAEAIALARVNAGLRRAERATSRLGHP